MNILDPKFKYVPAAKTDVRRTIRRERRRLDGPAPRLHRTGWAFNPVLKRSIR